MMSQRLDKLCNSTENTVNPFPLTTNLKQSTINYAPFEEEGYIALHMLVSR